MALPLVLAPLFGRAISLVRHRQKFLFLGDQQLASTEAQIRAAYREIIPKAASAPFDGALKLSLLPRYRERQMISCLYFANLLGFEHADVVDIDDRGCTNIIHNLNDPGLLEKVGGGYDVIFDGGTLEHIFSPAAALENIGQCTRTGGVVIHLVPMNNMINHGFYQLSPTLFFDYYGWNKWEMLLAFYVAQIGDELHVYKANAKEFSEGQLEFPAKPHSVFMVARRVEGSTVGVKPTQGMYAVRLSLEREYVNLRDALSQADTPAK